MISDPELKLEDLNKVFLRSSNEIILRMQDFRVSYIGRTYWGGYLCKRAYYNCLREEFTDSFEEGDQRKAVWVKNYSNRAYSQSSKYMQGSNPSNTDLSEDHVFLRLAEQYLIRAESKANLGKISEAIADLNILRARAGLPDLSENLTKSETLDAIEKERRVELFSEEGHRWWDLKRTGRIDAVLGAIENKKWESYKAVWPIPEAQLNANPNLVPNPGYGTID